MRNARGGWNEAQRCRRRLTALLGVLAAACCALAPAVASAGGITNSGGDLRDGWYSNQGGLSPDLVSGGTFGQLFKVTLDGQIYAQPLVSGNRVIVATERNKVYSLDPETGEASWTAKLRGEPWQGGRDVGCWDLWPDVGATATPVVDTATNTIYLTHKSYNSGTSGPTTWWLDALDASTGAQRSGFPVALQGSADNAPGQTFDPLVQLQRPGLLLLDGVVYAAFGSVCDFSGWKGWVFGVSTAGATKARWVSVASGEGAGIWQAGSGIMSDGSGRLFVSTGNTGSPTPPLAGTAGAGYYGESVVRLQVQSDGKLKAADFFAPFDAASLDEWDADFASGGVTALRDDVFGTPAHPHLAMAVGKSGYVYLLDRDDLGGIGMGAAGGDAVVRRVGPRGGVWSRPGIWPGDGGWVWLPTASGGTSASGSSGFLDVYQYTHTSSGAPDLALRASSTDAFGFGSSAPVITSDAKTSGSALAWTVWMANGAGDGGQLRAYDAVPQNGKLRLRGSWPVGSATKFSMPGVGNGRIYVGTRYGDLYGFGAPVSAKIGGGSTTFPTTTVGSTASKTATLTASGNITVTGISATPSDFAVGAVTLPKTLAAGGTLAVPLTFSPSVAGPVGGTLTVTTDQGAFTFTLSGTGQAAAAKLAAQPAVVSFGGVPKGRSRSDTMTFSNQGGQPLKILSTTGMAPPFASSDPLVAGQTLQAGESVSVPITFTPSTTGTFTSTYVVHSDSGDASVGLSGTAVVGPRLTISPSSVLYGSATVGTSVVKSFSVANTGDGTLKIMKSKPPLPPPDGAFEVLDRLDEGTTLPPGTNVDLRVRFTPTAAGPASDTWILTGDDGSGQQNVGFDGTGVAPAAPETPPSPEVPDGSDPGSPPGGNPLEPSTPGPGFPPPPDGGTHGAGEVRSRVAARLRALRPSLSRDGRRLTVRARLHPAARGTVTAWFHVRTRGTQVTRVIHRHARAGKVALPLALTGRVRRPDSARVTVRFGGDAKVRPQTVRTTWSRR